MDMEIWKLCPKIRCQQIATSGASRQTRFNQSNGLREEARSGEPRMTLPRVDGSDAQNANC
jgi:hypothetical protein